MTTSTKTATSATNDTTVGALGWFNFSNVAADDGNEVQVDLTQAGGGGDVSYYLKATGFGFSLPSGATVSGVEVTYERRASSSFSVYDNAVKLVVAGSIAGDDKADGLNPWNPGGEQVTRGGSADLWGLTLTDADVNASSFGVGISARCNDLFAAASAYVDIVEITITYSGGAAQGGEAGTWTRRQTRVVRSRPTLVDAATFTTEVVASMGGELALVARSRRGPRRRGGASTGFEELGQFTIDVACVVMATPRRRRRSVAQTFAGVLDVGAHECLCPPSAVRVVGAHGAVTVVSWETGAGGAAGDGAGSASIVGAHGSVVVVSICIC